MGAGAVGPVPLLGMLPLLCSASFATLGQKAAVSNALEQLLTPSPQHVATKSAPQVAICITGEPRSFPETSKNLHRHILDPLASQASVDVFMYVPEGAWPEHLVTALSPIRYATGGPDRVQQLKPQFDKGAIRADFQGQHVGATAVPKGDEAAWSTYMLTLVDQQQCFKLVQAAEMKHGQQYDWLLRVRVDTAWYEDSPPIVLPQVPSSPAALVCVPAEEHGEPCQPGEASCYVSDKFLLGTRSGMEAFFNRVDDVLSMDRAPAGAYVKSEWLLAAALKRHKVTVRQETAWKLCKFGDYPSANKECTEQFRKEHGDFKKDEQKQHPAPQEKREQREEQDGSYPPPERKGQREQQDWYDKTTTGTINVTGVTNVTVGM